ncbi:MAG: GGDEF domain-containing protein [Spirochaetes bacterium]|nr:GGDEF domain-containing protein [Spirochaetota bacterium]
MPDSIATIFFLGKSIFLITNIILLYIFLSSRQSRLFHVMAFFLTWAGIFLLRLLIRPLNLDPFLDSFIMGSLYLIPCILIFKETFQAKIFVFFMNYSLTQLIFLIFLYIGKIFSPEKLKIIVLTGLILEMASLPLIKRYVKTPVKDIINYINQQHSVFTIFPILSFLLLAFYTLQKIYIVSVFLTLVLSTILIIFSYYLIAITISGTRRQLELELISKTDSLTGLYNRRYIEQKIMEEYKRYERTGLEFALVIADIDFFKNINDAYGHDCGDYLLKTVSEELLKSVRTYDTVSRWGGEEFLILLPSTSKKHGVNMAERIRKTVAAGRYNNGNVSLSVTLTLGVYVVKSGDTLKNMIRNADMALYYGKRKSRNCVISFDEIK